MSLAPAVVAQSTPQGDGTEVIDGLEIHPRRTSIRSGYEAQWVVRLDKRPVATGLEGYRPANGGPTRWEPAVEFHWNFGDGTGWISTGERPSITHRYMDAAEYVLEVEARSDAGTVRGQLPVLVVDRDYLARAISAIEIDPATDTYELTADVKNLADDDLTIRWQFPGGSTQEGPDLWRVTHSFAPEEPREVTVTWTGDDGTETTKTQRLTPERSSEDSRDALERFDDRVVAEGVRTRFEGAFTGPLTGEVRAEIRPFAGIFLGATAKGVCRFMMTAWDPQLLVGVQFMANIPRLSKVGHRYRHSASTVQFWADEDAEQYLHGYTRTGFNEMVSGVLGGIEEVGPSQAEINASLRDKGAGFVQYGPRERQLDGGAAVATSPLVSEHEGYQGVSGSVEFAVVPGERVVGLLDLVLEGGTYEDGKQCREYGICKRISLDASFVLDLEAAPRDGLVRYEGCLDPQFEIDAVYGPEPGERHVGDRKPRIAVSFSDDVDPETLDTSTFQIIYPDRGGEPVPVEARIHRDDDGAFIKPVEDLWGGVHYTVRVKTGEDGVRGLNGGRLAGGDAEGWKELRDFWTRLDFIPDAGSPENLSCHVHQTVRDAPLQVDKWAAARVHARWTENPEVHESAQVATLPARVVLGQSTPEGWVELARQPHEFPREATEAERPAGAPESSESGDGGGFPPLAPDEVAPATLTFMPDRSTPETIRVRLEVDRETAEDRWRPVYTALCSTPVWKPEPRLRITFYVLNLYDQPAAELFEGVYQERLNKLLVGSRFPVDWAFDWKEIEFADIWRQEAYPDVVELPELSIWGMDWWSRTEGEREEERRRQATGLITAAWSAFLERVESEGASTDLAIGLVPHFYPVAYLSSTPRPFYEAQPGRFFMGLGEQDLDGRDLLVSESRTILHMIGHYLGLEDTPDLRRDTPTEYFIDPPFEPHRWVFPPGWHDGIEFSQYFPWRAEGAGSGEPWLFASSRTGNHVPLMASQQYPRPSVMLRHHYLKVQEAIEDNPGRLAQ